MEFLRGAAVVGQSGGPTAAINATLAGVIDGYFREKCSGGTITGLYGMRNGIEGLLKERLCNLGELFAAPDGTIDEEKKQLLINTPAAALGSCRNKRLGKNIGQASAGNNRIHMGSKNVDVLCSLTNTSYIDDGAGEDNVNAVFFGRRIGRLCKLENVVAPKVRLRTDLEKGSLYFTIGHSFTLLS